MPGLSTVVDAPAELIDHYSVAVTLADELRSDPPSFAGFVRLTRLAPGRARFEGERAVVPAAGRSSVSPTEFEQLPHHHDEPDAQQLDAMKVEFLSRLADEELQAMANVFENFPDPTLAAHMVVARLGTATERHECLTLLSPSARVAFARRLVAG